MAKHLVKCLYCGKMFDANKEEFVMPSSRRYAHKACAEKNEQEKTKEQKDKEALEAYIKSLFQLDKIPAKIQKQIEQYIKEKEYTYSGIKRSLIYFFEIKQNSLEKANGGIGIVPWVYQDAYNYYYNLWLAQQRNQDKNLEDYKPNEITITITPPERKIKRRKIFSFLDMKETDD